MRTLPFAPYRSLLLSALAVCLAACTPNKMYHKGVVKICEADAKLSGSNADLHVLEFDEQGDVWDHSQLGRAIKAIEQSHKIPLVVTFVHGWRHDAEPCDSNLEMFRGLIATLQAKSGSAFKVHGVYVGWRGGSVKEFKALGPLNNILAAPSFFGRRSETDRIARVPLTNTLLSLTQAARKNGRNGKAVIIGHSFGGRVVEHAMSQAIVTTSSLSSADRRLPMPADLVFLINQASESLTARQLKIALTNWPKGTAPVVVAMTSESDTATGGIWPIGLKLATLFGGGGKMRDYEMTIHDKPKYESQETYYTRTPGHDPRQITHRMCLAAPGQPTVTQGGNVLGEVVRTLPLASGTWELRKAAGNEGTDFVMYSDAYWVLSLPKTILDGHSGKGAEGIFNQDMRELMADIVKFSVPNAGQSKAAPLPPTPAQAKKAHATGVLAAPVAP
jgi:hypothetical protein